MGDRDNQQIPDGAAPENVFPTLSTAPEFNPDGVNTSPLVHIVTRADGSTYAVPRFVWTAEKEQAACDLAEGMRIGKICDRADVTQQSLYEWRKNPEFQARVAEYREEFRKRVMDYGIARREVRIAKLQEDFDGTETIIEERAAALTADHDKPVPGGASGRLGRKETQYGTEYRFDRALIAERRELLKQSAIEVGDWQEKGGSGESDDMLKQLADAIRSSPHGDSATPDVAE